MPESFLRLPAAMRHISWPWSETSEKMRAQSPSTSPEMRKTSSIGMVMRLDPNGFVMYGQLSLL